MTSTRTIALALAFGLLAGCGGGTPPADHPEPPPPLDDGNGAAPTASATPATSSPAVQQAFDAIQAGDFAKAKQLLTDVRAKNPKDAEAALLLGVANEKLGDAATAAGLYREAMTLNPKLIDAAVYLAALLHDTGDAAGCADAAAKGLAIQPKQPDLLLNRALCLEMKGDKEAAAKAYGDAVDASPDDAELRIAYAQILAGTGQKDKAVEQLKQVKTDKPELVGAIANMFGKLGEPSACLAVLDKPIADKPSPDLLVRRGVCKHDLKDAKGEKADYEAALKLKPDFAPAHYYLGLYYRVAKNKKQAIAELEKAVAAAGGSGLGKAAQKALDEIKGKK